jgi:hypothetical protein
MTDCYGEKEWKDKTGCHKFCKTEATKTVRLTMSGSIEDYTETVLEGVKADIAVLTNVSTSKISLRLSAGSVVVTATMPAAAANELEAELTAGMSLGGRNVKKVEHVSSPVSQHDVDQFLKQLKNGFTDEATHPPKTETAEPTHEPTDEPTHTPTTHGPTHAPSMATTVGKLSLVVDRGDGLSATDLQHLAVGLADLASLGCRSKTLHAAENVSATCISAAIASWDEDAYQKATDLQKGKPNATGVTVTIKGDGIDGKAAATKIAKAVNERLDGGYKHLAGVEVLQASVTAHQVAGTWVHGHVALFSIFCGIVALSVVALIIVIASSRRDSPGAATAASKAPLLESAPTRPWAWKDEWAKQGGAVSSKGDVAVDVKNRVKAPAKPPAEAKPDKAPAKPPAKADPVKAPAKPPAKVVTLDSIQAWASGVVVEGAGCKMVNGGYDRDGEFKGRPMWTRAETGLQLWWNDDEGTPEWRIGKTSDYYYVSNAGVASAPWVLATAKANKAAAKPAPTVTVASSKVDEQSKPKA